MNRWRCCIAVLLLSLLAGACAPAGPTSREVARSHYRLGQSYVATGDYARALQELHKAVALEPRDAQSQALLAQTYQLRGAYDQALQHYQRALALKPDDPEIENNLAALYLDRQEWNEAARLFRKVADNLLFPYPVRALTGLGVALSRGGEPVQAVMAFHKALRLFPGNPTVLYLLGETYFDMGKHDLACDALTQALRLEEDDNGIRFLYGESLVKLERYDEALEQFREIANREDDTALGRRARDLVRLLEKN